ncbi:unnamed protein product [Amaranthus hypochondriacus]
MAGWSKLEGCKSIKKLELSSIGSFSSAESEFKHAFVELISVFLEESCKCFRPVPPMLGNGHSIDLLKLYFVVKLKGGFDAISSKKLWNEVGLLYGLGYGFGSALKLIYLKYLDSLESWLVKLPSSESSNRFNTGVWSKGVLMALGSEYGSFVSNVIEGMRENADSYCLKEEKSGISYVLTEENNDIEKVDWNKFVMSFGDEDSNEDSSKSKQDADMSFVDGVEFSGENDSFRQTKSEMSYAGVFSSDVSDDGRSSIGFGMADNVVKSCELSCDSKKCSNEDEELVMDSSVTKEVSSLKRKRDDLYGMLHWMVKVSKNPTDPKIGIIPEIHKLAAYGNENFGKQVLLFREALFMKRKMSTDQSIHQKKQKMHPSMFDDNIAAERPRSSPRLLFENSLNPNHFKPPSANVCRPRQRLGAQIDKQPTASIYTSRPCQRIPIGDDFQAVLPKWTGVDSESDPKWLGTQVWPLAKRENTHLTEREPIGKGRLDSCGCRFPDSSECVKLHVGKTRMNMKYELASAFYAWKFDKMGEECSVSWTSEEEKTFISIVKQNPYSLHKRFWKQMCEALPKKSWADQVNYYFNVFVLRRRAFQNRFTPRNIDSDDDETEHRSAANSLGYRTAESRPSISSSKLHLNMK